MECGTKLLPVARKGGRGRNRPKRVLDCVPLVYLGPSAAAALESGRGLLLGEHRPGWVDALSFLPLEKSEWKELVERRFSKSEEVIGIVLAPGELARWRRVLARELIPGDVVLLATGRGRPRCYVDRGDKLVPASLRLSRGTRRG